MKRIARYFQMLCLAALVCLMLAACKEPNDNKPCDVHIYGEATIIKNATCIETGESQQICMVCGAIQKNVIEKTAHTYENMLCTVCGIYEDTWMKFELNEDGVSYCVTAYQNESATEIVVPATYMGKPVTAIGNRAFAISKLKKITLPESIVSIGEEVFANADFTEIALPDNITFIGDKAFSGCVQLKSVKLPANLKRFGTAFYYCTSLKELVVPVGVTEIAENAFTGCASLESVIMLGEVETVGKLAFENCEKLNVFVAGGTPAIKDEAFRHCNNLYRFEVPDGVSEIGKYAFSGCRLHSITLAADLTEIGENAFGYAIDYKPGCNTLAEVINYSSLMLERGSEAYAGIARFVRGSVVNYTPEMQVPTRIEYIGDFVYFMEYGTSVLDPSEEHRWYTLLSYLGNEAAPEIPSLASDTYILEGYTVASYAFQNDELMFADFPEGVKIIEDYAFWNCDRLLRVDIPSTVNTITVNFCSAECLAEIVNRSKVDLSQIENRENFVRLDQELDLYHEHTFGSAIQNVDGVLLIDIVGGGRYIIGYVGDAEVLHLPDAFAGGNVYVINPYAFSNATFKSIVIPVSVTSLGYDMLIGTNNLERIVYEGTKAEWDELPYRKNIKNIYGAQKLLYILECTDGTFEIYN